MTALVASVPPVTQQRGSDGAGALDPAELALRKGRQRVSVVVPARDEAATVAGVVAPVVEELQRRAGLVDEVLVVDGSSRDATAELARAAGARVVALPAAAHGFPLQGKGGAVWWSQFEAVGDLLVLLDADVEGASPTTVTALLAPLLHDPSTHLVKAAFDRPLVVDGVAHPGRGGRVTELLARPLLTAWWPELAFLVQPLAGETAVRRSLLERLPVQSGYGLELGLLLDTVALLGVSAVTQVDIGERVHRHHPDADLGRMAASVLAVASQRLGLPVSGAPLRQFVRQGTGFEVLESEVVVGSLPPASAVAGYAHRRAG